MNSIDRSIKTIDCLNNHHYHDLTDNTSVKHMLVIIIYVVIHHQNPTRGLKKGAMYAFTNQVHKLYIIDMK